MDKFSGSITTKDAAFRCSLTSPACTPQYFAFQLKYGDSEISFFRHTSASFRPVSTAFNILKRYGKAQNRFSASLTTSATAR